jgi:hypothetical protein
VVLDDTLAHKRGAKVAFGGIFLDAVLSTKKHKVFRFGNNWVVLGVVAELACRPNRFFCLSILWRIYEKQGNKPRNWTFAGFLNKRPATRGSLPGDSEGGSSYA